MHLKNSIAIGSYYEEQFHVNPGFWWFVSEAAMNITGFKITFIFKCNIIRYNVFNYNIPDEVVFVRGRERELSLYFSANI